VSHVSHVSFPSSESTLYCHGRALAVTIFPRVCTRIMSRIRFLLHILLLFTMKRLLRRQSRTPPSRAAGCRRGAKGRRSRGRPAAAACRGEEGRRHRRPIDRLPSGCRGAKGRERRGAAAARLSLSGCRPAAGERRAAAAAANAAVRLPERGGAPPPPPPR